MEQDVAPDVTRALLIRLVSGSLELAQALECDRLQAVAFCARELEERRREALALGQSLSTASLEGDADLSRLATQLLREQARARLALRFAVERLGVRRAGVARAGTLWYGGRPLPAGRQAGFEVGA